MTLLRNQQLRALALRRACGLNQADLALALKVNQGTISRWERRGVIPPARMDQLVKLAETYENQRKRDEPSLRVAAAELAELVKRWCTTGDQPAGTYQRAETLLQMLT